MIKSRKEALGILGLTENASAEQIKSAYRAACKSCHPDSISSECDGKMREYLQLRYQMVSEAYDYLLNAKEAPRARILGGEQVLSKEDNNRSRKERLEKEAKARRDKRYQELREEGKRLRQKEEAEKIVDEIRWMRLAKIIRGTIEEDKKREELEAKISEAIRKKQ